MIQTMLHDSSWLTQFPCSFVIGLGKASKGIAFGRGMFAPLDPSVNELYAFHGTFVRYALSIAENEARLNGHQEFINFLSECRMWLLL